MSAPPPGWWTWQPKACTLPCAMAWGAMPACRPGGCWMTTCSRSAAHCGWRTGPTAQAADITAAGLLHDGQRDDWQLWARAAGRPQLDTSQGIVFVDSNAAIEAALAGRGVALARRSMVVNELEQGRLLALQVPPVVTPLAYYLVFREPTLAQPAARRFHDWLLAQAALARTVDG